MEDEIFFGKPQQPAYAQPPEPSRRPAGGMRGCGCMAIALAAALAALAWIFMKPPAEHVTIRVKSFAPKVCNQLRATGKMQFYKEQVREMGQYKRVIGGINTASLEILYFGTMQYGCDLSEMSEKDLEMDTALNILTVHLPKCRLLYDDFIDEELTRKYYDNSWINFDPRETEKCKADAYSKMLDKYPEQGIKTAERMGEDIIAVIIENAGFDGEILVKFDL